MTQAPESGAAMPAGLTTGRQLDQVTYVTDEMPIGTAQPGETWVSRKELIEWQDWGTVMEFQGGSMWREAGWISYGDALDADRTGAEEESGE